MVLRDHVSAIDELAMATERLRVRHPDEPKPNPPVLYIIEPHEVKYLAGKKHVFLKESISYKVKSASRSTFKVYNMPLFLFRKALVE